jgi:DnaB-helicase binding domain of primase
MEYFIKKSLIKYDKNNIDDKKNIIQDLSGLVSSFANKIEKEYWIRSISEKLDVSEKILFDTFNKSEYQYKKFESEISDNKPKADPMIQDRSNNIQIQIMGLLISDNNIWKESLKRYKKEINEYFSNKKILDIISNKGREIDFNFEKLLNGIEDEKQKAYLRKLYFENIEKGEEFSSIKEKLEAVDKYFVELKKEAMKASLEDIVRRIKAAESSGKKEEVRRLTEELVDLSKQS